jgi:hypothetical protein
MMKVPRTILFLTAISVLMATSATSAMSKGATAQAQGGAVAIAAIDAAIKSLTHEPNQFEIQVTCTGLQATSNGGGTGLNVTTQGGAAGSQTTGMVVSSNSTQCTTAQGIASDAVKQQADQAIKQLTEIKAALQAPKVDKPAMTFMLAEFEKTYVAPVVTSILVAIIKRALHL